MCPARRSAAQCEGCWTEEEASELVGGGGGEEPPGNKAPSELAAIHPTHDEHSPNTHQ